MQKSVVDVRPVVQSDIPDLAANLREQDRAEVLAYVFPNTDIEHAISVCVSRSDWSRTATVDGKLACIFGIAPVGGLLDPRGNPWMLGTDLVPQNRRALARLAPGYIRAMLQMYPHLLNVVHARNTLATRWIARSGFTLGAPFDFHGEPFQLFEMKA